MNIELSELQEMLLKAPEQIKKQQTHCAELILTIEQQRAFVEKMKNKHLDTILSAMDAGKSRYSNDKQRAIALEKCPAEDQQYIQSKEILDSEEKLLKQAQIELDFLHNSFSAWKAIAGMQMRT